MSVFRSISSVKVELDSTKACGRRNTSDTINYFIDAPTFQKWNDTLSAKALSWANNCEFARDNESAVDSGFATVGQNLYAWEGQITATYEGLKQGILSWIAEGQYYDIADSSCSQVCDSYLQVGLETTVRPVIHTFILFTV